MHFCYCLHFSIKMVFKTLSNPFEEKRKKKQEKLLFVPIKCKLGLKA